MSDLNGTVQMLCGMLEELGPAGRRAARGKVLAACGINGPAYQVGDTVRVQYGVGVGGERFTKQVDGVIVGGEHE